MSALRVARAFTGRDAIVKFEGHYHQQRADGSLLVKAGSGAADVRSAGRARACPPTSRSTRSSPGWNDLDSVKAALEKTQVAAVILEPFPGTWASSRRRRASSRASARRRTPSAAPSSSTTRS